MPKNIATYLTPLLLIGLLPGCGAKKINIKHLSVLKHKPRDYVEEQQKVTTRVKKLTPHECDVLFGSRGKSLLKGKRGIQPIKISIENKSDHSWLLNTENIDLTLSSYKYTAARLHRNGALGLGLFLGKMIGITSLFYLGIYASTALALGITINLNPINIPAYTAMFWPGYLALLIGTPSWVTSSMLIGVPCAALGSTALPICNKIDRDKKHIDRKEKNYIKQQSLRNWVEISPLQTIETLIFVQNRRIKKHFTMTLTNTQNEAHKLQYHINLKTNKDTYE